MVSSSICNFSIASYVRTRSKIKKKSKRKYADGKRKSRRKCKSTSSVDQSKTSDEILMDRLGIKPCYVLMTKLDAKPPTSTEHEGNPSVKFAKKGSHRKRMSDYATNKIWLKENLPRLRQSIRKIRVRSFIHMQLKVKKMPAADSNWIISSHMKRYKQGKFVVNLPTIVEDDSEIMKNTTDDNSSSGSKTSHSNAVSIDNNYVFAKNVDSCSVKKPQGKMGTSPKPNLAKVDEANTPILQTPILHYSYIRNCLADASKDKSEGLFSSKKIALLKIAKPRRVSTRSKKSTATKFSELDLNTSNISDSTPESRRDASAFSTTKNAVEAKFQAVIKPCSVCLIDISVGGVLMERKSCSKRKTRQSIAKGKENIK